LRAAVSPALSIRRTILGHLAAAFVEVLGRGPVRDLGRQVAEAHEALVQPDGARRDREQRD
jgi:hypothetical protein